MNGHNRPNINVRRANERGHADHGWLNSYHTFSFADYYDPNYMGFRALRVINDDTVGGGMGFGTHSHRDMEIISFVVDGQLEHQDSMGHDSVIEKGHAQCISAGKGITHSEFNHSFDEQVHFLQIWIKPSQQGLTPSYAEIDVGAIPAQDGHKLIASPDGQNGSVKIHQDALVFSGYIQKDEKAIHKTHLSRGVWIQVINGALNLFDQQLQKGDGISLEQVRVIEISTPLEAEFLLFDLK